MIHEIWKKSRKIKTKTHKYENNHILDCFNTLHLIFNNHILDCFNTLHLPSKRINSE